MQVAIGHRICLVVALAALRVATAGQQSHAVLDQFSRALRIQEVHSPIAHSLAAAPAGAPPTKDANSTKREGAAKENSLHNAFKLPDYQTVDSLGKLTNGYLDWFVVIYWGMVLLFILTVELVTHLRDGVPITHSTSAASLTKEQSSQSIEGGTPVAVTMASRKSFLLAQETGPGRSKDLAPNVWALNLVASHGKALDQRGNALSPRVVFFAGIGMGLLQLLTLFLVVYDIDPSASPYTDKPSDPWKKSPLTVNTMKVVMVFFLGMYVVSEAADAYDNYLLGLALEEKALLVHRFFVLFIPIYHYFITLCVILAGVSVVLSCQDVPNILYNSMAILFITRVDELFWGFFERTFDIDAEWRVQLNESEIAEVQLLKKCIIMFPMLWGFCLLGRAWYRDQMPALVVRAQLNNF